MAEETATPKKKRGPRKFTEEEKNTPVFLRGKAGRSSVSLKVMCEGADANTYALYMEYSAGTKAGEGRTKEELESIFNGIAWGTIWNRDAGFKEFRKKKAAEAPGVDE